MNAPTNETNIRLAAIQVLATPHLWSAALTTAAKNLESENVEGIR